MAEGRRRIRAMLAVGAATGLASGLLGVGGGFVMVPGMVYWLKTRQHEAHGTSLAVIIPVAAVGALILGKGHDVDVGTALLLAIGAVGGAVAGARLTRRISALRLRQGFGVLATIVGGTMVVAAILHALGAGPQLGAALRPTGMALIVIGLALGLVAGVGSGLLGIGGGAIMVPAMVVLLGLSQHVAQGTSLAVIIPTAISGSITHFRMGNVRLATAAWLSVGGIMGAVVGALAALAAPDEALRLLFGGYLAFTGVRMLQGDRSRTLAPTMADQ
ncbi:MAG TPA: sulfite exporter TauE/SafE family protein [Candidatus Dormibacteraeota bacterium]|jgi:hypothetical protein